MSLQSDISNVKKLPALEELQGHDQWVCWRKEQRDKNLTKVTYNPQTGRWARLIDPGTWASDAIARSAYERSLTTRHPYDGIVDGLSMITGNRQEFGIIDFMAPERKARLRYKIGVRLVHNGVEQFYLSGTIWVAERKESDST